MALAISKLSRQVPSLNPVSPNNAVLYAQPNAAQTKPARVISRLAQDTSSSCKMQYKYNLFPSCSLFAVESQSIRARQQMQS